MKLAALGILHETNTFSSVPTDDDAFAHSTISGAHGDLLGEEVWDVYGDTGIRIAGAQIAKLREEGPFDGVLMAQHGACVAEGYPDGDAEMIRRVREVVGPR